MAPRPGAVCRRTWSEIADSKPSRHGAKARLAPDRIEHGLDVEIEHHLRIVVDSALDAGERGLAVAAIEMDAREIVGDTETVTSELFESCDLVGGSLFVVQHRERPANVAEGNRNLQVPSLDEPQRGRGLAAYQQRSRQK